MKISTDLLNQLTTHFDTIEFVEDSSFYWSPSDDSVHYDRSSTSEEHSSWSLLHEVSHGALRHTSYRSDYELVKFEVEAWSKALEIAPRFSVFIDRNHIEDCLDTYRDWIYTRSTCPTCSLNGLQINKKHYSCLNCLTEWSVSPSRFCRQYRKLK